MTATSPHPEQRALPDLLCPAGSGARMYALVAELYPICRSITGDGVRATLDLVERLIRLERSEVPSGTPVLDWVVPPEWNIRGAYIANVATGERVLDFRDHSLHVLNYSAPVHVRLPLEKLKAHIATLPDQPDLIPYRTSYYAERWGFCMSHNALAALPDGEYEAHIDSTLAPGSLTYGEHLHRGESEEEILLQAHTCHPSLANDNCSGIALLAQLAALMAPIKTRYSYRFLFAPGTLGAITWLARNEAQLGRIKAGLVLSCVGDGGGPTYKRTRRGDARIDRIMAHVLASAAPAPQVLDFFPYGYDERQYNSPGFKIEVGLFQRSLYASFPEYHTSADNLEFVRPEHLEGSLRMIAAAIDVLERDGRFVNLAPRGEPQLGRRGLYQSIGGDKSAYDANMAMLWVLNLSDGEHSLLDIAERAKLPFAAIADTAERLQRAGLLAAAS